MYTHPYIFMKYVYMHEFSVPKKYRRLIKHIYTYALQISYLNLYVLIYRIYMYSHIDSTCAHVCECIYKDGITTEHHSDTDVPRNMNTYTLHN